MEATRTAAPCLRRRLKLRTGGIPTLTPTARTAPTITPTLRDCGTAPDVMTVGATEVVEGEKGSESCDGVRVRVCAPDIYFCAHSFRFALVGVSLL